MGSFFNSGGSRRKNPRYERLPLETFYRPDSTDLSRPGDQDDDNLLFDLGDLGQNGRLLPSKTKNSYDSEEEIEFYKDSRRAKSSFHRGSPCRQGKTRCSRMCLFIMVVTVIVVFCILYFLRPSQSMGTHNWSQQKTGWTSSTHEYGTETAIRLYDVNLDGIQDVLMGASRTMSANDVASEEEFCKSINETFPCVGVVMALDGRDGTELWTVSTRVEVFAIHCGKLDINIDGHVDCIAAGRMGTLCAIDPINGAILWSVDPSVTNLHYNFYHGQDVPDLDQDGVGDYVVTHGGNSLISSEQLHRPPGRLILLSGKTGKSIGRYLTLPTDHETYSSITLYQRQNGAIFLLFGSGGETIRGSLWMISLRALYCYVKSVSPCSTSQLSNVPAIEGAVYDEPWGSPLQTLPSGLMEIIRSGSSKGVTVPTEVVDMNNDGVDDLIVLMYNSTIAVLDGTNLQVIWSTGQRFAAFETYSNPAPGYFNDDDTLDIMVRLSQGIWGEFNSSHVYILDGRNGEILWSLKTPVVNPVMSSPITIQSYGHKDAFLFWVMVDPSGKSIETSGEAPPSVGHGIGSRDSPLLGRRHRRHGDEETAGKKPCEEDAADLTAELLLMDRDLALKPLRLATVKPIKYKYTLTDKDKQHEDEPLEPLATEDITPHVLTTLATQSPRPTAAGNAHATVTEDLARHDELMHQTTVAVVMPEGETQGPDATTNNAVEGPTEYAVSMPGGVEPSTNAQATDAILTSEEHNGTTTPAVTVPEGERQVSGATTTTAVEGPTAHAVSIPEGVEPTMNAQTTDAMPTAEEHNGATTPAGTITADIETNSITDIAETTTLAGAANTTSFDTTIITADLTTESLETTTPEGTDAHFSTGSKESLPTTALSQDSQTSTPAELLAGNGTSNMPELSWNSTTEIATDELMQETGTAEGILESASDSVTLKPESDATDGMTTSSTDAFLTGSTAARTDAVNQTGKTPAQLTESHDEANRTVVENSTIASKSDNSTVNTEDDKGLGTSETYPETPAISSLEGTTPPGTVFSDTSPLSGESSTRDGATAGQETSTGSAEPGDKTEPRRKRRETAGGNLCTVYIPTSFGTGIVGDLDADGNFDYIYAENHVASLMDEGGSFIKTKARLSVHRLVLNSAIKRQDWVRLAPGQVTLSDAVHSAVVDREDLDEHFHFLPAERQSWTSYMGKGADGKFKKTRR